MWRVLRVPQSSQFFASDFEYPTLTFGQRSNSTSLITVNNNNNHFRTLLQHCDLVKDLDKQIEVNVNKGKSNCEEQEDEEEKSVILKQKRKKKNIFGDCLEEEEVEEELPSKKKKLKKKSVGS